MKRLSIVLSSFVLIAAAASSCGNSSATATANSDSAKLMSDAANYTTVSFTDSVQDFGTVSKGEKVNIVFHVMNTGSTPLLIADARPSCGCTVASFTKTPIEPGKQGEVTGTFDSNHGSAGDIRKTITVTTNTSPKNNVLIFTGQVLAKDASASE